MKLQILVQEGLNLVALVKLDISFIRASNYTQASLNILETAAFNLSSAEDLLNYANELQVQNIASAAEKLLIACDAIKKVQLMLAREFNLETSSESKPWFDHVSENIGAFA